MWNTSSCVLFSFLGILSYVETILASGGVAIVVAGVNTQTEQGFALAQMMVELWRDCANEQRGGQATHRPEEAKLRSSTSPAALFCKRQADKCIWIKVLYAKPVLFFFFFLLLKWVNA